MKKVPKIVEIFVVFIVVIMTSSLLQGHFVLFARGWIWLAAGCAISVIFLPKITGLKHFWCLLVYAIVLFLNFILGDGFFDSIVNVIVELSILLLSVYLSNYITNIRSSFFIKYFVLFNVCVITITSILTILADLVYPGVVRETVTLINGGYSDMTTPFYKLGVCEYAFPHAIPIIIPALVLWVKNSENKMTFRGFALFLLLLCFYLVYISGVMTALLMSVFSVITSFLVRIGDDKKSLRMLLVVGLLSMPFVASDKIMLDVLRSIEQITPDENEIKSKIIGFEDGILEKRQSDNMQTRGDLYGNSISAFGDNILMGTNDKNKIGEHSNVMDRFGALGLAGGVPYILFILFLFKYTYKNLCSRYRFFYIIGFISFFVMIGFKNMGYFYTWIYVSALLPSMLLFDSLSNNPPQNTK